MNQVKIKVVGLQFLQAALDLGTDGIRAFENGIIPYFGNDEQILTSDTACSNCFSHSLFVVVEFCTIESAISYFENICQDFCSGTSDFCGTITGTGRNISDLVCAIHEQRMLRTVVELD